MKNVIQPKIIRRILSAVLFLALSVVAIAATAESVQSVGQMTFADADTVIIADPTFVLPNVV
jgi:hypothetical protein